YSSLFASAGGPSNEMSELSNIVHNVKEYITPQFYNEPIVLKSSIADTSSTCSLGINSFVFSVLWAYNTHKHLVIRPDDIWLAVMTQFSFYINANSEELRSKIVPFDGQRELVVRLKGELLTAPYEKVALEMAEQLSQNIKDPSIRDWVMPDFSTTTSTDRLVGAFTLMSALKNYFSYKVQLMCGLPKVTMMGTVDDWQQLIDRAQRLLEFDNKYKHIGKWLTMLMPVLDKIIQSVNGTPDVEWWNRIANHKSGGSGPATLSGWITTFLPFTEQGEWVGESQTYSFGQTIIKDHPWPIIPIEDIPRGYTSCPLKIEEGQTTYNAEIFAGHIVSKLSNGGNTISPQLDWCILQK
ncbi:hypothetical protein SAMD00019534_040710, partial [Acytostelium subglobosum LB1]|uniref:hypothetical protein n=1 Tax=Acytostelium subglobosum LB1 TaxID=1410327 RepID=UPI000644B7B9